MKKCPNGHEVSDDVKFCPQCGAEIKESESSNNVCKTCGAEFEEGAKFCSKCGTPLGNTSDDSIVYDEEEYDESIFKKYLPHILGCIVVACIILGWYGVNGNFFSNDEGASNDTVDTIVEDSVYDDSHETSSVEYQKRTQQVDVTPILYECQEELTSIQREIESTCRTFAIMASDNNIDMMTYGQMKITFSNGVDDLVSQADKAFDNCARKLREAGVKDATSKVNEEKRQFHNAISSLKMRTLQQAETTY